MDTCLHGIWVPLATPMLHGELDLSEQSAALAAVLEVARKRCPVLMDIGGSYTFAAASRVLEFDAAAATAARYSLAHAMVAK